MNFLGLSVVHDGMAVPIVWPFLPKQGHADTRERLGWLHHFSAVCGAHKIEWLLADRAFIGAQWFAYVKAHHIRCRIRMKRNMHVSRTHGPLAPALNVFRSLPVSTSCTFLGPRLLCGHGLGVTGRRLSSGEYVIRVSNDASEQVREAYKKRGKIEVLCQALQARGLNFEATHFKDEERLKTLWSVLAIAFCWADHVGAWRHGVKPIRIKKHQRPAKSILRYGCDWMRQAVLKPADKRDQLPHVLSLLWDALTAPRSHVYQLYLM